VQEEDEARIGIKILIDITIIIIIIKGPPVILGGSTQAKMVQRETL